MVEAVAMASVWPATEQRIVRMDAEACVFPVANGMKNNTETVQFLQSERLKPDHRQIDKLISVVNYLAFGETAVIEPDAISDIIRVGPKSSSALAKASQHQSD
jgi:hypothetical protein